MKRNLLLPVVAKQFYIHNSGLFLLFLLFGIGFLSGREHIAIATSIATSTTLTLGLLVLWVGYLWLNCSYTFTTLAQPENRHLINLIFYKTGRQLAMLSLMQAILNLPVIAYGSFITIYAIKYHQWHITAILAGFLSGATIFPPFLYRRKLSGAVGESASRIFRIISVVILPSWIWAFRHLLRSRILLFSATKLIGCLMLIAFYTVDSHENFDWRWLCMGFLLVASLNMPLIFEVFAFYQHRISWHMNMPLTPARRIIPVAVNILLLLVPELITAVKYSPLERDPVLLMQLAAYTFGICLASYACQHFLPLRAGASIKYYFFLAVGLLLMCMFSIPPAWVAGLLILFSLTVLMSYYSLNPR